MTPTSLLAWRRRRGLGKAAAAAALGVSRNSYAAYEAGRAPIPFTVALACAALAHGLPPAK